jgi:hemerythrin
MALQWTPDQATGIAGLDSQHRDLHGAAGHLQELMRTKAGERISGVLAVLRRYVAWMPREEEEMQRAAFPGLASHRAAHARFADELQRRSLALSSGAGAQELVELSNWLNGWIRDHLRMADRDMARHVAGKRR